MAYAVGANCHLERPVWRLCARPPNNIIKRITPVERLMVAWNQLVTVPPNVPLLEALMAMDSNNVNQLPVLNGETLVGVLTRDNVLHFLRRQAEFAY